MKNKHNTPDKCEESKEFGDGLYVCKIELLPCPVILGKECAKVKQEKWLDNFKEILRKNGSDGE